ncbi:hypothetical protein KJC25_11135 [Staphylococcus hominis]|uniref:phage tail spike protein n=1 Tax=Staphylococcus hominis TaxID=1290 RepID=UPI001F2308D0|nr:phage tail spike protein [Staphylococcus hominis]MCE4976550.1 hypothetical protein [Staphylococcus hominis]
MKNVGIHVLDFNDNIIDFISQSDGALINAEMSMNVEEKTETFDFTIENTRAEKLRERNRIIAQDNNGTFREFIIIHITDNFDGTTEIECNASYLEDLKTAKPIKPGKFEAHTTTQALLKTLADTGWEVSDNTEYGGNRTTSWTSHTNPFDLIYMLCTTYDMVPSFYIELGAHTVEHRYVSITKPKNLFKGKEITKGKDLTGMTRTIDLSEVKTALLAVGPEKEDGSRIETVVVDDEAQQIFGLPNRYIWDVYEPESNDENMTLERLTTLAKTELNKRNQAAISYEVSSLDIHKYYNDVTVHLRDIVRVKDRDFRPPLYIEAEVIGIKYNWLADESEFTFGNVIEYEETKLRESFNKRLDEITKKLNDNISNVNTIVSDVVAGELEYYERKIFKGSEPPENPQNDTLWYDTSNPDVAVLRRYWNGKWITQTADDVEKIGGLRREQVMYRDLNNSFINLTIQHSRLQNDVYDVLNSEYLVDDDLKASLNQALSDVDSVYQNIKTNLDSMDEETATIGKLVDTQTLFTVYREKLQTLYKYVTEAKISIDRRLKLLQSQYTDEKFNDAMDKIAQTLPNGRWDSENQQLYADIPNEQELSNLKQTLQDYYDGNIKELEGRLNNSVDSKVKVAKDEISANVKSVESRVNGVQTRVDTTESNISALKGQISLMAKSDDVAQKLRDVDGRLTPLETTVQSNKATLDILPTQIDSKVSKQDYTLDKDNIVQRLDNADSQRKQLSNEITDKVTITEFNSGMDATANYLESYADDKVDNLSIGSENLLLDSKSRSDFTTNNAHSLIHLSIVRPLEIGETYTFTCNFITTDERQSGQTSVYPYKPSGIRTTVNIKNSKITYTFTAQAESTQFLIYKDVAGQSDVSLDVTIENAILVKGNKVTDWSLAPQENDKRLSNMETSISQNGREIQLKVSQQDFNASRKTLSQVISEISATTKGINLSYDENGNIQSYTMDRNGIQLRGDKVDITVNKDFNVMASKVDDKVGKNEIVNRLNFSPEGLDINANRVGIRGGNSRDSYVDIRNDRIELGGIYKTIWQGTSIQDPVYIRFQRGHLRMRNDNKNASLYYTFNGISTYADGEGEFGGSSGTISWWDNTYSPSGANGITVNSHGGVAALTSNKNRVVVKGYESTNIESENNNIYIRPRKNLTGYSAFSFTTSVGDTDYRAVKGYLMYGDLEFDEKWKYYTGFRFYKGASLIQQVDSNFTAGGINTFDTGTVLTNDIFKRDGSKSVYWNGSSGGTIENGPNPSNQLVATSMVTNYGTSNMYLGTRNGGTVYASDDKGYNRGGTRTFNAFGASKFINMSHEKFKTDISEWNYDALSTLVNDTQIYQYKLKKEVEMGKGFYNRGLVIGDGYKMPIEFRAEEGVNLYEITSWLIRAIQQLNEKIENLEEN